MLADIVLIHFTNFYIIVEKVVIIWVRNTTYYINSFKFQALLR